MVVGEGGRSSGVLLYNTPRLNDQVYGKNGACERRSETSSGSWMVKVARDIGNSVRQQEGNYITVIRHVLLYGSET